MLLLKILILVLITVVIIFAIGGLFLNEEDYKEYYYVVQYIDRYHSPVKIAKFDDYDTAFEYINNICQDNNHNIRKYYIYKDY